MSNPEIKKISDVSQQEIETFFEKRGIDSRITRWKYFDTEFNSGRNRGYVALSGNRPVGFIGLIPFRVAIGSAQIETAWTCDWHIDEEHRSSMLGILLLKKAIASYPSVFHVGGNDNTRKVFERLASHADATGMSDFRCYLRLGAPLRILSARFQWARQLPVGWLARIPLALRKHKKSNPDARFQQGLTDGFLSIFARQQYETDHHAVYDEDYIRWQIGRCPELTCFTYVSDRGTAAVAWYVQQPHSEWRMIISQATANAAELESCIETTQALAYEKGADSMRILTSRHDEQLRNALVKCGFGAKNSHYYYAFHENRDGKPATCMSGLSFLDVDFVYLRA